MKTALCLLLLVSQPVLAMRGGYKACFEEECQDNFPSVVKIESMVTRCSATKISDHTFITAAHCVPDSYNFSLVRLIPNSKRYSEDTYPVYVKYGGKLSMEEYLAPNIAIGETAMLTDWLEFPMLKGVYHNENYKFDVAIFKIKDETPNIPVTPICSQLDVDKTVILTGWGRKTNVYDKSKFELDQLNFFPGMKIKSANEKEHTFDTKGMAWKLFKSKNVPAILKGDSGAGVFQEQNGVRCLVGVNSAIIPNPINGLPMVHRHFDITKTPISDWIENASLDN